MEFNNTTCITETEEINELIDDVNQYLLITQGIIVSVIGIVGMVINIFVMIVILANKQLHTRPFMLCLQVIVVNIFFILLLYIPKVLTYFVQAWLFGSTFCIVTGISAVFVLFWRYPVMFLMILDRLLTVAFPFCYNKYANKIMIVFSVLLFFSSLLVTLAPLVGIGCYNFNQYALLCLLSFQCPNYTITCYLYYVATSVLIFIVGAIVPIFMYAAMYIKARNLQKGLMSQSISNSSQFRKSEWRARKTLLLLFICLVCLTLPTWLFYLVTEAFQISPTAALFIVGRIATGIYYCVPIADATVMLRNKDIKSAIRRNMKDRICSKDTSQEGRCTEAQFPTDTSVTGL